MFCLSVRECSLSGSLVCPGVYSVREFLFVQKFSLSSLVCPGVLFVLEFRLSSLVCPGVSSVREFGLSGNLVCPGI